MNAIIARLLGAKDIVFNDSEPISAPLSYSIQVKLFMLLTRAIITPAPFKQELGEKHIKVESFRMMKDDPGTQYRFKMAGKGEPKITKMILIPQQVRQP